MKKIINGVIISISIVLIGFVILFSLLPNIVLNVIVTLCGFTIPIFFDNYYNDSRNKKIKKYERKR